MMGTSCSLAPVCYPALSTCLMFSMNCDQVLCFSSLFWASADDFERFGMPSQIDCHQTGQGTGSCGVGVILSARDFIFKGAARAISLDGNIQK